MLPLLRRKSTRVSLYILAAFGLVLLVVSAPPLGFSPTTVVIERGETLPHIARTLTDKRIIAHPLLLSLLLRGTGTSGKVQPGAYLFLAPQSLFTVGYRIVHGSFGLPSARITFTEGMTVRDYGELLEASLPNLSAEAFIKAAQGEEGYLFPDTYLFQPGATTSQIIERLRGTFDSKIEPLQDQIEASGHSQSDIVIMASLIEKEARTDTNRRLVAGVLWNRLKKDMPLQVDAVFGYIFNRDTYSPSFDDLKVDSPYNTYLYRGLPPGPIDNPGLESIDAALHPTPSTFLYYLVDDEGVMHYATTYDEQLANQRKYLK